MAPFSIPAPCIIPIRIPVLGGPRSIDTKTRIELFCDTHIKHVVFYTLDGTKPQPYAGIVQGSKTFKYTAPFCLPPGKITVKAVAINAEVRSMDSSVVTKCFDVIKLDPVLPQQPKEKMKEKKIKRSSHRRKVKANLFNSVDGSSLSEGKKIPVTEEMDNDKLKQSSSETEKCNLNDKTGNDEKTEAVGKQLGISAETSCSHPLLEDEDLQIVTTCIEDLDVTDEDSSSSEDQKVFVASDETEHNEHDKKNYVHNESYFLVGKETSAAVSEPHFCCSKCEVTLQCCISCHKMNFVTSKYCIQCGERLVKVCYFCKEQNPIIATFCQYCGKKLEDNAKDIPEFSHMNLADHSIMVKPEVKNADVQGTPVTVSKCVQTRPVVIGKQADKHKSVCDLKKLPNHSPGRGYWHQQLDYICNHLKTYAYNNMIFRNSISEPVLSDFKSAEVTKNDDSVIVTITFAQFDFAKYKSALSKESEKNKHL
ncbi:double zinc ribbon and ankyrin repeat-containing protein 1-like [Stegodyphus dumicola]|uniref:double zinc ribbon and ankyrin repeat-containing protein 1-like n=1 Tax=Stegodyphus dumicola TaxID=202533 RepID=UPI0015AA78B5|nr:double zinc ribbon and ankyrin repeat-containing protein 1-like [Stegodyphus dumicola]